MNTSESLIAPNQQLANDMQAILAYRVEAATPIEVLSERGDKLLQVVQEQDGQKFVTRSFSPKAVAGIERRQSSQDLSFPEAWEAMHEAFSLAGIPVVRSALLENVNGYPYVAVSEYIENGKSLAEATTDTKGKIAGGLGRLALVDTTSGFVPTMEMINADMFMVKENEAGQEVAQLTDVDPLVRYNFWSRNPNQIDAAFVDKLNDLFWDRWCSEDERRPVFVELVKAIAEVAPEDSIIDFGSPFAEAFHATHFMSNDVDTRKRAAA